MSRPLRIEFSGALYHVVSRGDRQDAIYLDDDDRQQFLTLTSTVCERFNWICHAYCLMTNHYHLVVETPMPNLSQGMRQLNGVYTQRFNIRHAQVGHVFQGRYTSHLIDKESYLIELSRYVVLNPVRTGMVHTAEQWPWSSYRAMIGLSRCPTWLETDITLSRFDKTRHIARQKYIEYVSNGTSQTSIWTKLRQRFYLGDERFIAEIERHLGKQENTKDIVISSQGPAALTLEQYLDSCATKKEAMRAAYASGGYTLKDIADYFGVHYSTVSRAVKTT